MKKKFALKPAGDWETGALEVWLEQEAAKGWRLTAWVSWFAVLERVEPAPCRVRIQPRAPEAREDWETRLEVYRDLGWAYAAQMNDYEVYYCDDPAAAELESDPVAQKWAWDKSLKSAWRWGWLSILLFAALAVFILYLWLSAGNKVEWFLQMGPELVLGVLICAVGILGSIRKLLAIWRTRNLLDAGVAPPHTGNWRKSRRLMALTELLLLLFWIVHLVGLGMTDNAAYMSLDNPELPYVAAEVLDPALTSSIREDSSFGTRERAPLALARYSVREFFPDQNQVTTTYDRLLFSALAGPLYREKLDGFREQWPDAALTVLDWAGFDQAVLLESGEISILLACRGKAVLTVWTNTGADLSAHLDDFARLLNAATPVP